MAHDFDRIRATEKSKSIPSLTAWKVFDDRGTLFYTYVGPQLNLAFPDLKNISCNSLSGCGASVCLSPDLEFSYGFNARTGPQERWSISREQWVGLLSRVDAILSSIVLDRSGGDR
jgi:hypothetical protein